MMYHSQDNWSGDLRAASNQVLFAGKFVIAMIYIGHALNKKKAVLFKLFPKKKDVILYSIPIPSSPHTPPNHPLLPSSPMLPFHADTRSILIHPFLQLHSFKTRKERQGFKVFFN